ncbi:ABC transporter ATP-binding protein [Azoarcus sp. TTM-91]|uniref:ABC transporter ATP-binding protein n=1 Tax=Azoarcus sp. TTM-91 TaxID=2691581 RepID=UPI002006DF4A|nr:ABC transporter ATP-binding protein [Azoarcus sp. TTM-91]
MMEQNPNPMLQAAGVGFNRGRRVILDGVDLQLAPGDILALLGANGAGKTTLLRCLLGLLKPDAGVVRLNGRPLSGHSPRQLARHLAYVPQAHAAPFPYTVRQVVTLGRLPHHGPFSAPAAADLQAVEEALTQLGIQALAARPYTELSGGERQLALIARALAQGARTLVMDEPVTGLDFGHQIRLLERIERLAADGYAILKTTHHPDHALACATRVALLHEGRIDADGPPADVLSPAAIRRLYRVDVELLQAGSGRSAFVPAG